MKYFLSLLILFFCSSKSFSQEKSMYIGGLAGFTLEKSEDPSGDESKYTSWSFSPEIGTWLTDDVQFGLALNISREDWGNLSDLVIDAFAPGVYVRKWKPIGEKFSIFGGANVAYNSTKIERSGEEAKHVGFNAYLDFGAGLAINERWNIVGRYATLGYSLQKDKDSDAKTTTFGLDVNTLGNPFNIGIYYTFKQ